MWKQVFLILILIISMVVVSGCTRETATCAQDIKQCPDGTTVGRNPDLNCDFDPCPGDTGPTGKIAAGFDSESQALDSLEAELEQAIEDVNLNDLEGELLE